jgi:hypothetical protein
MLVVSSRSQLTAERELPFTDIPAPLELRSGRTGFREHEGQVPVAFDLCRIAQYDRATMRTAIV